MVFTLLIYLQYLFIFIFFTAAAIVEAVYSSLPFPFDFSLHSRLCLGFLYRKLKTTINSISTTIRSYVQNLINSILRTNTYTLSHTRTHAHSYMFSLSFSSFSTLACFLPLTLRFAIRWLYLCESFPLIFHLNSTVKLPHVPLPCKCSMFRNTKL